jgi:hypothetical protein
MDSKYLRRQRDTLHFRSTFRVNKLVIKALRVVTLSARGSMLFVQSKISQDTVQICLFMSHKRSLGNLVEIGENSLIFIVLYLMTPFQIHRSYGFQWDG